MLLKKSEKFRPISEPCTNPKPPKSAPAPPGGGGGAWWPKILKFGANPPTHPYTHPPTPPGGVGYFAH